MENTNKPSLASGDLLELSPLKMPSSILKPSQRENLILLQTPVHKQLKVSFMTPKRTPAMTLLQPMKNDENSNVLAPIFQENDTPKPLHQIKNTAHGFETPKSGMPGIKRGITPRKVDIISCKPLTGLAKIDADNLETSESLDVTGVKWDSLRQLDENLRWRDRVEVITKLDHKQNICCAREFLYAIIERAMDFSESAKHQTSENFQGSKVTSMLDFLTPIQSRTPDVSSPIGNVMAGSKAPIMSATPTASVSDVLIPLLSYDADTTNPAAVAPSYTSLLGSEIMNPTSSCRPNVVATVPAPCAALNETFDVNDGELFWGEKQKHIEATQNGNLTTSESGNPSVLSENFDFTLSTGILKPTKPQSGKKASETVFSNFPSVLSQKEDFKSECHSYISNLGSIAEDFDPFSPFQASKASSNRDSDSGLSQEVVMGLNCATNTEGGGTGSRSVFSPAGVSNSASCLMDDDFKDEEFVDSTTLLQQGCLDLDYLDKKTSGDISASLRKQSLYVKFDPLLEDLGERQSPLSRGRKSDIIDFSGRVTPIFEEEEVKVTPREPDLLCDSPIQLGVTEPCNGQDSANYNGGSGSPTMKSSEIEQDSGIIEVLAYSEEDIQRILSEKEEKWSQERTSSIQEQNKLEELIQESKIIMEERAESLSEEAAKISTDKAQNEEASSTMREEKLKIGARISKFTKLSSTLFQQMETLQKSLANSQANELKQKEYTNTFRKKFDASQKKICELEKETTEKIKKFRSENEAVKASLSAQLNKVQMKIKTAELRVKGLQSTIRNKKNENLELLKICDELMATNEPKRVL